MIADAALGFVIPPATLSLVAADGVAVPTDPYDILGAGAGTTVANIFGNSALPGQADALAAGSPVPYISVLLSTALTTGNAATLTIQFQGAPDNGSGSPGTWQTYAQSPAITAAQGLANTQLCRLPFVPPFPFNNRPRFLRLNFATPASTHFTAGVVGSALVVTSRDDFYSLQQPSNYSSPRFTG